MQRLSHLCGMRSAWEALQALILSLTVFGSFALCLFFFSRLGCLLRACLCRQAEGLFLLVHTSAFDVRNAVRF